MFRKKQTAHFKTRVTAKKGDALRYSVTLKGERVQNSLFCCYDIIAVTWAINLFKVIQSTTLHSV
jgi:hypothetical protein